jgi:hypothetical protein
LVETVNLCIGQNKALMEPRKRLGDENSKKNEEMF